MKTTTSVTKALCILVCLGVCLAGCGKKTTIVKTPSGAENALFTSDGRLFVTGLDNLFEVTKESSGQYAIHPLYSGTREFGGLAQSGAYLYVLCGETDASGTVTPYLLSARIDLLTTNATWNSLMGVFHETALNDLLASDPTATRIALPNGMGADTKGYLYFADSYNGRIMRLKINPDKPKEVSELTQWWKREGLYFTNGIAIKGSSLYLSGGMEVHKITIQDDGTAGEDRVIHTRTSFLDDLTTYADGVIVADFISGTIFYVTDAGKVVYETYPTFAGPSSVHLAQAPLFEPGGLIVTEQGLMGKIPAVGNQVSLFTPKLDLSAFGK
jgi:hypothetical protein